MNADRHVITKWNLLQAQVCSGGSWDEALDWLRKEMPAGTTNNWQKDERTEVAPIVCANDPARTHYLFVC